MVIAIDGPAGSGKSTIAKMIAEGLGMTYVNSGNLYRALTWVCLKNGIDVTAENEVVRCAETLMGRDGASGPDDGKKNEKNAKKSAERLDYFGDFVYLEGKDITPFLHSDEVDRSVAALSAFVPVRHAVNGLIRRLAAGRDIVVEGRDMTTVVFPDAAFRFYLDASSEERSRRRLAQGVSNLTLEELRKSIEARDEIDRNKREGALKIAPGVVVIDTTGLTLSRVYDVLVERVKNNTRE